MKIGRYWKWVHPLDLTPPVFFAILSESPEVDRFFNGPPLTDMEVLARQAELSLEPDW